ncbi:hypothetical protein [Niallia sp. NCCP-28]|nr:hypothetical protein [Niallia sp. NCCP-28]GKU84482.1 hypothetical protein NCCP28_38780 [Niallia sp. NCCP-28]
MNNYNKSGEYCAKMREDIEENEQKGGKVSNKGQLIITSQLK